MAQSILGSSPVFKAESKTWSAIKNLLKLFIHCTCVLYQDHKPRNSNAHKYFVESIAKAYQELTDPISRENFEKYGHPDGRQGFQMGIALPQFQLNIEAACGGILLL
ncbi:hypothetical protein L2E82_01334 [Cichorium intybus]|uniref:Uncharacterized protein n=1 Tax=Cichorium intybus TaxID=13427 RepID=A0ACB9GYL3_CICIN|nr:hypothetical protein L2E82_01334 [Cichorium intybus]